MIAHTKSKHNSKLECKLFANSPSTNATKRKRRTSEHGKENLNADAQKLMLDKKKLMQKSISITELYVYINLFLVLGMNQGPYKC